MRLVSQFRLGLAPLNEGLDEFGIEPDCLSQTLNRLFVQAQVEVDEPSEEVRLGTFRVCTGVPVQADGPVEVLEGPLELTLAVVVLAPVDVGQGQLGI